MKVKIHPLTLATLLISSLLMATYAYRNFRAEEMAYGIIFVLLCAFLLALVIFGVVRNRSIGEVKK